jgi:amino acid transporter
VTFVDLVIGRRLANREQGERRIGTFEGVPAMGLDAIASSAYGPEAALTILIPLGAMGASQFGWIMLPIGALLLVLFASYWQTIHAYPTNGGAYTVTRENLGTNLSLLAAAALMIDYVLDVAVGISSGVGALVSAVPELHSHMLALCLGTLLFITLVNLRGTLDAGRLFAFPTYLFVASFTLILAKGVIDTFATAGHPRAIVPPPRLPPGTETVSAWLLLRAFASGCTAMTGVEAVSNGVGALRQPTTRYGHRILSAIVLILEVLLAGITCLVIAYPIGAMDQTRPGYQSVLSQIAGAVVGRGTLYYVAMAALITVLSLSANTGFVDFPRLCRVVAADSYLPKSFAIAGHRLVYSVGILYLAATAGALLLIFGGVTDRLIPLFAIGAFLTFTLSQTGMVVHWRRERQAGRAGRMQPLYRWLNTIGALMTGMALGVIVIAKFSAGAWITVLVIPVVIVVLKIIRRYYDDLQRQVRERGPLQIAAARPPIALVVTERWNRMTARCLQIALALSDQVVAVHLLNLAGPDSREDEGELRAEWSRDVEEPVRRAGLNPPRLVVLPAKYRAIDEPILRLVQKLAAEPGGRQVAVIIPEVAKVRWYEYVLHTTRASYLKSQLLRHGGPGVYVISVPWNPQELGSESPVR